MLSVKPRPCAQCWNGLEPLNICESHAHDVLPVWRGAQHALYTEKLRWFAQAQPAQGVQEKSWSCGFREKQDSQNAVTRKRN